MPQQTFSIAASADDQWVARDAAAVYPPDTTITWVTNLDTIAAPQRTLYFSQYYVRNALLRWDTSSIPDTATIVSAVLRIYIVDKQEGDGLSITAGFYTWDGVSATDWTSTPETNAISGVTLASLTAAASNDLALTGLSGISTTGYTYLRLHMSQRAADAAPTVDNRPSIASFDHATLPAPQLIVTYKTYDAHVGNDIAVDDTTTNPARVLGAAPATSDYGMVIRRQPENIGAVPCSFTTASGGIGGSTNEALATLTPVRDFATGTAATTFTVPAGKTMRVTGFWGVARRDTGTGSITWELEMNLHVDTGATATTASPIVFSGVAAWKELAASTTLWIGTAPVWFEIPGGIELPAGASFALGYRNSSSQPTRTTNAISVTGFEY